MRRENFVCFCSSPIILDHFAFGDSSKCLEQWTDVIVTHQTAVRQVADKDLHHLPHSSSLLIYCFAFPPHKKSEITQEIKFISNDNHLALVEAGWGLTQENWPIVNPRQIMPLAVSAISHKLKIAPHICMSVAILIFSVEKPVSKSFLTGKGAPEFFHH